MLAYKIVQCKAVKYFQTTVCWCHWYC